MMNKVKPFYLNYNKHFKDFDSAFDTLYIIANSVGYQSRIFNITEYLKHTCIYYTGSLFLEREDYCEELQEITPEDLPTWLKYGQTLSEYKSWENFEIDCLKGYQKPTLGLQPHKTWIQLRQYAIVEVLHRQVEANKLLNKEWVEELLSLLEEE